MFITRCIIPHIDSYNPSINILHVPFVHTYSTCYSNLYVYLAIASYIDKYAVDMLYTDAINSKIMSDKTVLLRINL